MQIVDQERANSYVMETARAPLNPETQAGIGARCVPKRSSSHAGVALQMDVARLDAVARLLAMVPRRSTLAGALGALLATVGLWSGNDSLKARKKKKKRCKGNKKKCGKKCILKTECCGGCGQDEACCNGTCFNLQTDAEHCGDCDTRCGTGEFCLDGQCLVGIGTCDVGEDFCPNQGVSLCNDFDTCRCHITFAGETRCGQNPPGGIDCGECASDAECSDKGPGAFCARATTEDFSCLTCVFGQGFCLLPCQFPAPS
jgi:hypothetical protein